MVAPKSMRSKKNGNENSKVRPCFALFVAPVTSLCPIAAIASSPLLAQSAPAETEKPKNDKPFLTKRRSAWRGSFSALSVHAGVLTFAQALGIVLGANIGTTIGGQIIAFDVAKYAPAFLLIGLLVHFFGSGDRWKNWGLAVIGAGLIFFGLDHIGSAMEPFKNYAPFIETMKQLSSNLFFGVLLGAGFTVAIQSSSGTMGIVIILASDGLIPLPAAVHLMLGGGGGHMRRYDAGEHRPVGRCLPDSDFSPSL